MKKILSILFVGTTIFASAQIAFSGKANMLLKIDKPTWQSITNTAVTAYNDRGKNNVGFNVGISAKISLPSSLFLMPEFYYTSFKSELDVPNKNTTIEIKSNRVDLPVLLGYNVIGGNLLDIYLGPVASYNLASENQFKDFKENARDNFTVGYQFGAQVQLQKFIITGRYEGAFSKDQRTFIDNNNTTPETIRYDSRQSLLMLGVGYQF